MEARFHRLFQKDLRSALFYYDEEGGSNLGDRFFEDVQATVKSAGENPRHFHFISETFRRAQLGSFPYQVVFEERTTYVKFLTLRHDKRHPSYGMKRT